MIIINSCYKIIDDLAKKSHNYFSKGNTSWGWFKFISFDELNKSKENNGIQIIENDTAIICAYIRLYRFNDG